MVRADWNEDEVPMNSDRTRGDLLVLSWHRVNSIEVVFIPSRREVIKARSATESRPKYSSLSIAWWLNCQYSLHHRIGEQGNVLVVDRGKIE